MIDDWGGKYIKSFALMTCKFCSSRLANKYRIDKIVASNLVEIQEIVADIEGRIVRFTRQKKKLEG